MSYSNRQELQESVSTRAQFLHLMQAMDKLGFERRERYYAGEQAGWGAQISEQTVEGIVIFCDVDLMPHETKVESAATT